MYQRRRSTWLASPSRRAGRRTVVPLLAVVALSGGLLTASNAFAGGGGGGGGGTAKPPAGAVAPFTTATLPDPLGFGALAAQIHGFDDTGFIQGATLAANDAMCPKTPAERLGGTLTINGGTIVVPCNMVIQMPANTLTWAEFVNGGDLSLRAGKGSFEMRAVGNVVGASRIAGLLFASQQSLHTSTGVITAIDYSTGALSVDTGGPATVTVTINDPKGRFGRTTLQDGRFSVDDANPTVHAGTGYPMCVPRTDPTVTGGDDPLCPQANRPKPSTTGQCRNFSVAGIVPPKSGELSLAPPGQVYCSEWVMPAAPVNGAPTTGMDPRQQAPFEVGDTITFSGTQLKGVSDPTISAHTVEANVGIWTMPGTLPSYIAIGAFGVGTADPSATSINGFATETKDRIFLEAQTTDVKTPVDIYMTDVDPTTGVVRNRWVTPFAMTGEQNGAVGGGITTQNTGPQPQRARIRATKSPAGLLSQPTRTIRVAQRSLCTPQPPVNDANGKPVLTALDTCLNGATLAANGLMAGEYTAPTFEFIFPENVKPGDLLVPYDLWHLPFLRNGEGATTASPIGPSVGPLVPTPW